MLDIEELDASLKLKALGRLKNSSHPMLTILRDKLDLKEYFYIEDKNNFDSVVSDAIGKLRVIRQQGWKNELLYRNRMFVAAVRSTRIYKALNEAGRNSLAFLALRRAGLMKLGDLNHAQLLSIKSFVNRDFYRSINACNQIGLGFQGNLNDLDYSLISGDKFYKLEQLTSKEIRQLSYRGEPEVIFKIGLIVSPGESLTMMAQINKLTSVRQKDILLRLLHGELYSKERLNRRGVIDSPECSRCQAIETLSHKYIDCLYVKAIWNKALNLTNKLRENVNHQEDYVEKIFMSSEPNKIALAIHSEIILRIRMLKDDSDHLLLPKIFVKNAVNAVLRNETEPALRAKIRESLEA